MPFVRAESNERQQEVKARLLLILAHGAHFLELFLRERDVDHALLALLGAEEQVAQDRDQQQCDTCGNECCLQPARPGDLLTGDLGHERHADRIGADGRVKQPGVGGIGKEVREHDRRVTLVLAALVAHAFADVVADRRHDSAARRVGGDHQRQDRVGDRSRVVGHELRLAHLHEDPVGNTFTEAGKLDGRTDESGPQAQPPAGAGKAGDDIGLHAKENCEDGRSQNADQILRDWPDDPHQDRPHKNDQHTFALRLKPRERHQRQQRAEHCQNGRYDQAVSLLFFHFLHSNSCSLSVSSRGKTQSGAGSSCAVSFSHRIKKDQLQSLAVGLGKSIPSRERDADNQTTHILCNCDLLSTHSK